MYKISFIMLLSINLFFLNSHPMFRRVTATISPKNGNTNMLYKQSLKNNHFFTLGPTSRLHTVNSVSPIILGTMMQYSYNLEEKVTNADINTKFASPLMLAAAKGLKEEIKSLLSKGENINQRNFAEVYPLHYAVAYNQEEVVMLLLKKGAYVDAVNYQEETPLLIAALTNNIKIGQLLIDNGADINAKTRYEVTPLFAAALNGNANFFKLLINNGAIVNINDKDIKGKTLLEAAYDGGSREIIEILFTYSILQDIQKEEEIK